ncbi:ATP-binding protein [Symbioplanes lichenis]|uniref:ATP-binding protein n=1 Tax=Symbioplanes lichenis TaxID=1629072 RepID=UPI0027399C2D|nr:ATP-binding protein [Actinoplanes lichenis]
MSDEWLTGRAAAAERETGTTFDLAECVREPIHLLGGVQSYGALVALRDDRIAVVSDNAGRVLGQDDLLGASVGRLLSAEQRKALDGGAETLALDAFDVTVHMSGELRVLEFEPVSAQPAEFRAVQQALVRLQRAGTVVEACQAAVREVRAITGYERVVAYRFESADGPGEVIAEEVAEGWEPWLGLWFPATDIPPQARRLYERNWIRVITDVDDETARLTGTEQLDLSLSVLRTVSPFHLEYLRNIGVVSSMSVSLLSGGRLWGLIACHGKAPQILGPQVRSACEFFGVALSLQLAALRDRDETAAREVARTEIARLLGRLSADMSGWLARVPEGLERVVDCDAVGVRMQGKLVGPESVTGLLAALPPLEAGQVWHSDRLGEELGLTIPDAAGALVLPLSASGDCIVWLRGERAVERRWAADPDNPVLLGTHGERLTPRGSTAVFRASVRGRSRPWSAADLAMAVELGRSIVEIAVTHANDLTALNTELNRSNVDLDSFAHAAAHDLKEPLRGIANQAAFIVEDAGATMDADTARRLATVQRLATRMDELLNALLHYSRLGRADLRREPIELRAAVVRALDVAGPRLEEAGVEVALPAPGDRVHADPVLLDEVLVNLLVNAAKYVRAEGPRRVAVALEGSEMIVRDNGIGIPPHLREQAFTLFRRLHSGGEGSGAGLAIVRRIVERHGGQVRVAESPGGGTTVGATFPQ